MKRDEDRLIGAVVAGRYQIERLLGAGSMGRVYRARHTELPRRFALKILSGEHAAHPRMRMRFAREAAAGSVVDHPNLVSALDFGSENGVLYLAMDYVEGETLAEVLAHEGPFEPARVIALARQLASGLAHAHERGLVHGCLKTDRILFDPRPGDAPVVRILDLGVGAADDLAPDVDLSALGAVLAEMLAARPPWPGNRNAAVCVPPALLEIVARLLQRDRTDRFVTARDLLETLAAVNLTHRPRPASVGSAPRADDQTDEDATGWGPVATMLALALLGLAGTGLVQASPGRGAHAQSMRAPARWQVDRSRSPSITEMPPAEASRIIAAPTVADRPRRADDRASHAGVAWPPSEECRPGP